MQINVPLEELAELVAARVIERLGPLLEPQQQPTEPTRLLTEREVAKLVGQSCHTLRRWRFERLIAATAGRRPVRYTPTEVKEVKQFIANRGGAVKEGGTDAHAG